MFCHRKPICLHGKQSGSKVPLKELGGDDAQSTGTLLSTLDRCSPRYGSPGGEHVFPISHRHPGRLPSAGLRDGCQVNIELRSPTLTECPLT